MSNRLLISAAVLAAAMAMSGCAKAPSGRAKHVSTNSEQAQQSENQRKQPPQPQQHAGQAPTKTEPGNLGRANEPSQGTAGGTAQQTQSNAQQTESNAQQIQPNQPSSGETKQANTNTPTQAPSGQQQPQSTQTRSGETGQASPSAQQSDGASKPNQAATGTAEQQTQPSQAPSGSSDQERKAGQAGPGPSEQGSEAGGQEVATTGENHDTENNAGESSQRNPTVGQNQSGTAGQVGERPIQPPQNQQGTSAPPTPPNAKPASGPLAPRPDEIRRVQTALKARGFDPGEIDGILGPRTRKALIAFQRRHGLDPTGNIDPPTMAALNSPNGAGSATTGQGRGTGASAATAARDIPKLNFEPSCKAAAGGILGINQDIKVCVQDELNARAQIAKEWNNFRPADRSSCTQLATLGGAGTYTELLTCLEMMRDARNLPSETTGMAPVTR